MNLQEYRNLQEAYLDVYQEIDEATAMAKRGLDEPAIRNKIASQTRGGEFADKAGKLADRNTYGNKEMKAGREKLARKQRGTFRDTNSSSPGLRGYGYKSNDPAVKAKQDARGNQRARAALTPNERKQLNMGFDLYDVILSHLLAEGYADTNENALVIMANMSEDWRESILLDEYEDEKLLNARKKSISRLNAAKDAEDNQADGDYENSVDPSNPTLKISVAGRSTKITNSNKGKSGYMEVPTDYHARKRRASGR